MISIAVIEDNRLVREGIAALLNKQPDLRVVASESGDDTSRLGPVKPQVILLDLGQNGESLRMAEKVKKEIPESRVIVMDLLPIQEDIVEFVHAGVAGFIMKDATVDDLVNTIRLVAKGVQVLPPQMMRSLFSEIAREAVSNGRKEAIDSVRLTKREREVIDLIAVGLSNRAIAERLSITSHTAKSHVRNIMEKLMLHTRLQISAFAYKEGTN